MNYPLNGVQSRNRNVFVYSSYWGTWSRVLWHKSDQQLARRLGLPNHVGEWIELDLTAVNPHSSLDWADRVAKGNVRCHRTARGDRDIITSTLPAETVALMNVWLPEDTVDKLLHVDYLPYLDFEVGRKLCNGGFKVNDALKDMVSIEAYLASYNAGPGVFVEDVRESYEAVKADWDRKMKSLELSGDLRIAV